MANSFLAPVDYPDSDGQILGLTLDFREDFFELLRAKLCAAGIDPGA